MDRVLKFFQIVNQIVWIGVGLATIYSIYWFITNNPLKELTQTLNPLSGMQQQTPQNEQQLQELLQRLGR